MKITRLTIREYAESLAIAFVLAMVIRHFVVEAFRIPTSSMEPTLIGNEVSGDRILVSKFQYDLHPPEQWDIVVFKIDQVRIDYHRNSYYRKGSPAGIGREANGTITRNKGGTAAASGSPEYVNYVKRLVGLPGREIQVIDGDVFIDGKIARKPPQVEESMLVPVTDDARLSRVGEAFFDRWHRGRGAAAISMEGAAITFAGSVAECSVQYIPPILDQIPTSVRSRPSPNRSLNTVGDVRLSFLLTHTGGAGDLICRLRRDDVEYVFVLPLGKPGDVPRILDGRDPVARAGAPFEPTGEHLIEVSNIDARAILRVDGDVLASFESNDTGPPDGRTTTERTGVAFGVTGCDVSVRDVRLRRDIYYTDGGGADRAAFAVSKPYKLAEDEYFMMGDNSPNSFDGRNWGVVKEPSLVGEAFFVFWPIPRWRFIN
jgi:signal peptidase I